MFSFVIIKILSFVIFIILPYTHRLEFLYSGANNKMKSLNYKKLISYDF